MNKEDVDAMMLENAFLKSLASLKGQKAYAPRDIRELIKNCARLIRGRGFSPTKVQLAPGGLPLLFETFMGTMDLNDLVRALERLEERLGISLRTEDEE